jgi:hypothetical protein
MNTKILSKDKDPMGAAILDYQKSGRAGRLRVLSSMFEEDEMPVKHLFRKVEEMPMLEQKALQLTKGVYWISEPAAAAIRSPCRRRAWR